MVLREKGSHVPVSISNIILSSLLQGLGRGGSPVGNGGWPRFETCNESMTPSGTIIRSSRILTTNTLPYRSCAYSSLPQSPAKPRSTMVLRPDQWPARKVRDTFLNFFKERRHTFGTCLYSI